MFKDNSQIRFPTQWKTQKVIMKDRSCFEEDLKGGSLISYIFVPPSFDFDCNLRV